MAYRLQFKPQALRQLEGLPRRIQRRLALKFESLQLDPFAPGCKKLAGLEDTWRIRVGDYRLIYQVHRKILLVLVLSLGNRRDVYR